MQRRCEQPIIILVDEINRQALRVFELRISEEIGEHVLSSLLLKLKSVNGLLYLEQAPREKEEEEEDNSTDCSPESL